MAEPQQTEDWVMHEDRLRAASVTKESWPVGFAAIKEAWEAGYAAKAARATDGARLGELLERLQAGCRYIQITCKDGVWWCQLGLNDWGRNGPTLLAALEGAYEDWRQRQPVDVEGRAS